MTSHMRDRTRRLQGAYGRPTQDWGVLPFDYKVGFYYYGVVNE